MKAKTVSNLGNFLFLFLCLIVNTVYYVTVPVIFFPLVILHLAEKKYILTLNGIVMLVAHSYGGIPATESIKGLTKDERQEEGKPGGIVRVAYMTALLPAVGSSAADVLAETPDENRVKFEVDVSSPPYSSVRLTLD